MAPPFLPLPDAAAFEAALARSMREPILIFKHSATCGISAQAHDELATWMAQALAVPVYLVAVRQQREVSTAIAVRFGIRHESPQLLLIESGSVRWHGSHWHVNAREVQAALDSRVFSGTRGLGDLSS